MWTAFPRCVPLVWKGHSPAAPSPRLARNVLCGHQSGRWGLRVLLSFPYLGEGSDRQWALWTDKGPRPKPNEFWGGLCGALHTQRQSSHTMSQSQNSLTKSRSGQGVTSRRGFLAKGQSFHHQAYLSVVFVHLRQHQECKATSFSRPLRARPPPGERPQPLTAPPPWAVSFLVTCPAPRGGKRRVCLSVCFVSSPRAFPTWLSLVC